jgi:hypothetical protein
MWFGRIAFQAPLTLAGAIELPRVEGRIDHFAVDLASQRLHVAALGTIRSRCLM